MELQDPSLNTDGSIEDQEDDWSRRVEGSARLSSSALIEEDIDEGVSQQSVTATGAEDVLATSATPPLAPPAASAGGSLDGESSVAGLAPQRPEPTLKEKLVERERQRRVETERARLKRQFALSSNGGAIVDEDSSAGAPGGIAVRENGSVAGTVGTVGEGSSVALHEPDDESEGRKLTYPMERFLQQQGNAKQESRSIEREREVPKQGVVMERFLLERVVVESPEPRAMDAARPANVDRTVSFDMVPLASDLATPAEDEAREGTHEVGTSGSIPSYADSHDLNASVEVMASVEASPSVEANASVNDAGSLGDEVSRQVSIDIDHPEPDSPSVDRSSNSEPRVLGLTEAEIQEMAAIEEASRSNAPPSDRDDISDSSFVGELVADFGGPSVDPAGTLSQGTPTTAMESASIASGNQSAPPSSGHPGDQHSLDGIGTASISSHLAVSSAGGSVSVTANPPSEIAEAQPPSPIPDEIHSVASSSGGLEQPDERSIGQQNAVGADTPTGDDSHQLELETSAHAAAGIVNRRIRPGMVNLKPQTSSTSVHAASAAPQSPLRRASSVPGKMNFEVDGFDYDKHNPMSPRSGLSDSVRDLPPDDIWSPCGKMVVSPLQMARRPIPMPSPGSFPSSPEVETRRPATYGTSAGMLEANKPSTALPVMPNSNLDPVLSTEDEKQDEAQPLLRGVPPEIVTSKESRFRSLKSLDPVSIRSVVDDVFSDIRSESTATMKEGQNKAEEYLTGHNFERVTLIIEIPVLLMVSGGSDQLCRLTGRSKYQLLMGFLPLSSAISGNVGLQASKLTTSAVSHGHVTRESYCLWLLKEVGAAAYLGLGMGVILGIVAFFASKFDAAFGFTIMIAQGISIITAGITGTVSPLLFSYIFNRDASKWGGLVETAIQDIVGAFTMVVLSYRILELVGPSDVDPSDFCGV